MQKSISTLDGFLFDSDKPSMNGQPSRKGFYHQQIFTTMYFITH